MTDVFISYKREERPRCVAIYNALVDLKLSVWFDGRIEPGTSFDREIEREVEGAKAILVLWSELARNSDWIRNEARTGKQGERLVAARLDDCLPPLEFRSVQTVDLFGADDFQSDAWCRIVGRIGRLVGRLGLDEYVRCTVLAEAESWRRWIATYGDDPLAPLAADRLVGLEKAIAPPAHDQRPSKDAIDAVSKASRAALRTDVHGGLPGKTTADSLVASFRKHGWIGVVVILASLVAWGVSSNLQPAQPRENAATVANETSEPLPTGRAEKKAPPETPQTSVKVANDRVDAPPAPPCSGEVYVVEFMPSGGAGREITKVLDRVAERWRLCGGDIIVAGPNGVDADGVPSLDQSWINMTIVENDLESRGIPAANISRKATRGPTERVEVRLR